MLIHLLAATLSQPSGRLFWATDSLWEAATKNNNGPKFSQSSRICHPGVLINAIEPLQSLEPILCLIGFSKTSHIAFSAKGLSFKNGPDWITHFTEYYTPHIPLESFYTKKESASRDEYAGPWHRRSDISWNSFKPRLDYGEQKALEQWRDKIDNLK